MGKSGKVDSSLVARCWCSRCYRLRNLSSPPSKRLLRRAWGRCPKGGGGQDQSRRSLIFGSIKAASIAVSTSSGCFSTSTFQSCREISSCPPPALSGHLPHARLRRRLDGGELRVLSSWWL